VTVTATSTQDTTKKGAASITVQAVPPTITSVSVSCVPLSVTVGTTSQCTASVQGTGNFNSAVTWGTTLGTVDANGLYTAPATAGTATITATSVEDATQKGSASVTVTAQVMTLTTTTKRIFADYSVIAYVDLTSVGVCNGDLLHYLADGYDQTAPLSSGFPSNCGSTPFGDNLGLGSNAAPSYQDIFVSDPSGATTNTLHVPYLGSRAKLGARSTDTVFYAPGRGYPVQMFDLSGVSKGTVALGNGAGAVSYDAKTNQVVIQIPWGMVWANPTATGPNQYNGISLSYISGAITTINGKVCAADPTDGLLGIAPLIPAGQASQPMTFVSTGASGKSYEAIASGTWGGKDLCLVYDAVGGLFDLFDSNGNSLSSVEIPGFTSKNTTIVKNDGGWQADFFASGPAAGQALAFSVYDGKIVSVTIDPTTFIMTVGQELSLGGNPIGISKSEVTGMVFVAYSDVVNGGSSFSSVDLTATPLVAMPLAATVSSHMSADLVVSSDGSTVYSLGSNDTAGGFEATPISSAPAK
jgi:hypothetical protein